MFDTNMTEPDFNKIFAENLRNYLNKFDMTQAELAQKLSVSATSVTNWCRGSKSPRMDKVDMMCRIFGCRRSDLIEKHAFESEDTADALPYYIKDDAREMAQFMFENPEYKVLFDASRKISKEDIETVKAIMDRFKRPDND